MRYSNIPLFHEKRAYHEQLLDIEGNTHAELIECAKKQIKGLGIKGKFYYKYRGQDKKFFV